MIIIVTVKKGAKKIDSQFVDCSRRCANSCDQRFPCGAIEKAQEMGFKGRILGARYGSLGLLKEDFIDLTNLNKEQLQALKRTPGSAIGTSVTLLKMKIIKR